jgi:hypothetical protein
MMAALAAVVVVGVVPVAASAAPSAPVAGGSIPAPFVACSAEQIRATQRWWFFGNRGVIDFGTTGTDVTYSVNPTAINVSEGTTVVTDTSGELVFYSDGLTVWNRDNAVMLNGSGLTAAPSATQTVAAFPSLSRPGIYFVVSNGGASESGGVGPLRYSEIDMSLDGGLGGVTSVKNVLLDGGASTATEGLTAVPNADGTGFWVITATGGSQPGNSNIVAHEFDGDGPTGTIVRSPMSTANGNQFGTLNLSPDMTRIAQHLGSTDGSGQLRLLQLNAETGEVTELVTWASPTGANTGSNSYSADFSPDGRYLYVTRIFGTGHLFRYDLDTYTTASDLEAHAENLAPIGSYGGQVKRAPDGRMYVASYNDKLWIVDDPDSETDPGIESLGLPSGAANRFGLPQTATGCPIPQNAPTGLIATASGYDSVDLTWSAPADTGGDTLLGYLIERSLDGISWSTVVANTGSTDTTYADSGLDAATEYFYRVSALYDTGQSDPSNIDPATTHTEAPSCSGDNVDCFPSAVTGKDVILEVDPACDIESTGVTASGDLAAADPEFSYPLGLLDFTIDCGAPGFTTQITQYYFDTTDDGFLLRKYAAGRYFSVAGAHLEETTLNGRDVLKVTYAVTDGGALDLDGALDGRIVDPAGLGLAAVGAPRTGAVPRDLATPILAIVAGAVFLAAAVAGGLRRRRT